MECGASDVHIKPGSAAALRTNGNLYSLGGHIFSPAETLAIARQILTGEEYDLFEAEGEIDTSYCLPDIGNFRINLYHQQRAVGIACRIINNDIPSLEALGLPETCAMLARRLSGLILVTGATGMGKSTTLAAMINLINEEKNCHIITLEDPIEYVHKNKKSLITQREIGRDSRSFPSALRAALRQDPDVIMIGEMRDLETISIALTAAETGHLVMATLHTINAPQSIARIIDVFPPHQQRQVQTQLAISLSGVISQRLLPRKDGSGRAVAAEIMVSTPAVRNLIREGKIHQIYSAIQTGARYGMQTMESHMQNLVAGGLINKEDLYTYSADADFLFQP